MWEQQQGLGCGLQPTDLVLGRSGPPPPGGDRPGEPYPLPPPVGKMAGSAQSWGVLLRCLKLLRTTSDATHPPA